jgi:hypothetical protein
MYATIRRYEGVTDSGEAGRRVDEGFVRLLKEQPGFLPTTSWTPAEE